MRLLCLAGVVAFVLPAGCGEGTAASAAVPGEPVRGTPFLRPAAAAPAVPREVAALGDVDTANRREEAPVAAPVGAAEPAAGAVVTFDVLAGFDYDPGSIVPPDGSRLPEAVRALDGREVAVEGFMWALEFERGGAKRFLLLKDPLACCFAVVPKLHEWIEVKMQGDARARYIPHVLTRVHGTLHVGEEVRDGQTVGLYRMDAVRTEFVEAR